MSTLVYIALILLVFVILYRLLFVKSNHLTSSQVDATKQTQITSDKINSTGTGNTTNNFYYSIWFYVQDWNYNYGDTKVLFVRGNINPNNTESTDTNATSSDTDTATIDNNVGVSKPCPMVTFDKFQNNVIVSMAVYPNSSGTGKSVIHKCVVNNFPVQKWVNLTVSVQNRTMDMYMDGKLVRTCVMPGVPKVDSSLPLYVTPNGGFSGWTAKLQYWPESCSPQKAWDIYEDGYGTGLLNIFNRLKLKIMFLDNNVEVNSITM